MEYHLHTNRRLSFQWMPCILLLMCLFLLTGCEGKRTIINAIEEKEANEILVFLFSKGIDSSKMKSEESGGAGAQKVVLWDIQVYSNDVTEAMALLNRSGLPRRKGKTLCTSC